MSPVSQVAPSLGAKILRVMRVRSETSRDEGR